jgi:hypothetical protein
MVFGHMAGEILPGLRTTLEAAAVDEADRDAFLLHREVAQLIRDLEPEEGLGEGVAQLAALVHHAYLYWRHGERTIRLNHDAATGLLKQGGHSASSSAASDSWYLQLPRQLVWGRLGDEEPYQPCDGCFATTGAKGFRVLGVFGVHPDRMGYSIVEVAGVPDDHQQADSGLRFSPQMDGAENAGLYSINTAEDLLVLAARSAVSVARLQTDAASREIVLP